MSRIVIAEFMDEGAVAQLAKSHEVFYDPTLVDDIPRLTSVVANTDALIVRNRTQVRGQLLTAMSQCRVVGRLGVGLDNIDLSGCESHGIQVIPATGANALSVAEYVISTALLLLRGSFQSTHLVAQGLWPRSNLSNGREIRGKKMGLIGFGSIGQLTASLAKNVGMEVVAFDSVMPETHPAFRQHGVQFVEFDNLVAMSDVISLHIPLLPSTKGLFDKRTLSSMKSDAVLINTSRGEIVDEECLAEALKTNKLGGAAIDVFGIEPLPISPHFIDCPNLLLTPHIAGVTTESNKRVSSLVAEKVLEALQ
jgi:(S)-sulfolactate dehydrogenase